MSAYETKGTIKRIGAIEQKSEKFSKRALILDVPDGKYPQVVEFQATGDRCALLDTFQPGDEVTVTWNLRGREWTGANGVRVFNSCDIWKIQAVGKTQGTTATNTPATSRAATSEPSTGGGGVDDLPFASCAIEREPSAIAKVLR